MTERKWTRFKDEWPIYSWVFVTDYEQVWINCAPDGPNCSGNVYDDYAWSYIDLPKVPVFPENALAHCCAVLNHICWQKTPKDPLFLECKGLATSVKFCPFCGYEVIE